jgi:putative ABC transport system ATP-binding protein
MDKKKILELKDIKREFKMGTETVYALKGISFDVLEGEFLTIMGASGAGKTTLLNILGCLDKPSSGTYLLDSVNVGSLNSDQLAVLRNSKIGFVFQSYNLLPGTSAIENVELPLFYDSNVHPKERKERAVKALEEVKLGDRLYHLPNQLSGGQQQRVAIARALINEPVMILADEATGNLDSRTSLEIMQLLQDLNSTKNKTIIFVTHDGEMATYSNRTVTLKDGLILKDEVHQKQHSAKDTLAALPPQEVLN